MLSPAADAPGGASAAVLEAAVPARRGRIFQSSSRRHRARVRGLFGRTCS
jgi:hypothetical protein